MTVMFVCNSKEDAVAEAILRTKAAGTYLFVYRFDNNLYQIHDMPPLVGRGYRRIATIYAGEIVSASSGSRAEEIVQAALAQRLGPDVARTLSEDIMKALDQGGYRIVRSEDVL